VTDAIRRHSLGIFIVAVLLAFIAATIGFGWHEYQQEQTDHGQEITASGFWWWWAYEATMSLVADVFGFALIIFATKKLYEIGSAESN
jgi:TRAP-type C4-dicarboxylate transport system permease small subunit